MQETWLNPALDFIIEGILTYGKIEPVEMAEGVQYLSEKEQNIDNHDSVRVRFNSY